MLNVANFPYLPIQKGNQLILTESKRTEKRGMDNDDDYYNEINPDGVIVASYHVWHHMNIYPPQNTSEGWEKYDPSGALICSGSCK